MIATRTPEKQQNGGVDATETKSRGGYVIEPPAATGNTHHATKAASRVSGGATSEQHQTSTGRVLPPVPTNSAIYLQENNPKQTKLLENILQKHSLEQSPPTSLQHHSPQRRPQTASPSQQMMAALQASGGDAKPDSHLDIKLQLLDSQLRHILKSSRDDSVVSSSGSAKGDQKGMTPRDATKPQQKSSASSVNQPQDDRYTDRLIDSGIGEKGDGAIVDGAEKYVDKWERGSVGDAGKRVSVELKNGTGAGGDEDDDVLVVAMETTSNRPEAAHADSSDEGEEHHVRVDVTRKPSVINLLSAYRSVTDDRSQTNHVDDAPSNVYLDDMATRAAPYTVVSQMNMTLGDSDGGGSDPEDHSCRTLNRAHSLNSLSFSPFSEARHGSHLMRQILDVSEKLGMREFWKRRDIYGELNRSSSTDCSQARDDAHKGTGAAKSTGASTPVSEHRPVLSILSEMPKPKFSTKSPSSPAKLSSLSKQSPDTSHSFKPSVAVTTMAVPIKTNTLSDDRMAGDSVVNDTVDGCKVSPNGECVKPAPVSDGTIVDCERVTEAVDVKCVPSTDGAALCEDVVKLKPPAMQVKSSTSDTEDQFNEAPHLSVEHLLHDTLNNVDSRQRTVVLFTLEERGMADGASPRLVDSESADHPASAVADWKHSLKEPSVTTTASEIPPLIKTESVSRKTTPPVDLALENKFLPSTKITTKSSPSLLDIFETRKVDTKCAVVSSNGSAKTNNFGVVNGTTEDPETCSKPPEKPVATDDDDAHDDNCEFGGAKLSDLECDTKSKNELSRVLHDIFGGDSAPAKSTFDKHIRAFNDPASGKFVSCDLDWRTFPARRHHSHSLVTDDLSQTRSAELPVSEERIDSRGSRTPILDAGHLPRPPPGHAPRSARASTAVRWAEFHLFWCWYCQYVLNVGFAHMSIYIIPRYLRVFPRFLCQNWLTFTF